MNTDKQIESLLDEIDELKVKLNEKDKELINLKEQIKIAKQIIFKK
jgi:peptidoglycan hydrolase CwlO-like protein